MKLSRFAIPLAILMILSGIWSPTLSTATGGGDSLAGDALQPPPRPRTLALSGDPRPSLYQPSAFMAGPVAVQALLVESDGSREASSANWTSDQIAAVHAQLAAALEWWRARLPNARLTFDLTVQVVPSGYEPIGHTLSTEGDWIGDALSRAGVSGANYFDQAYAADERLREARGADWATTIFVVNSAGVPGGRFADGHFAYAYIGGPFLVVTSDAGPYGTGQMAPVVAHELGHIFGALDQYASAGIPCTQRSGYLAVPTTNSQSNNCGSRFICIMLEPMSAYSAGQVDSSTLGQIGYRDSDGDGLPDPLDTAPTMNVQVSQPVAGSRPAVTGSVIDQPYTSPVEDPATINTIARVEYRVDGGEWVALPPQDGAYDSAVEQVNATLPLYDGRHTVELRSINSVGAASSVMSTTVLVSGVGAAPAYQVVAPTVSSSETIAIGLSVPAGAAVQMSEDPFFSGASWVPATSEASWSLSSSDGPHTLYVRFRDAGGLESPTFARSVLLDRMPPTGRAILHAGAEPWLEIQAQDSGSGIDAMQVVVGTGVASVWQPFLSSLPLAPASGQVQVRVRDEAGNVSVPLAVFDGIVYLPLVSH